MPAKELNRLAGEKSPYLLKHASNPVDWYPWGEEALKRAKNDGKPIFLSIGYFSCHWCSVMERESFEDRKVADFINKNFIPIKVDREERPDLDDFYMAAVQGMTGSGGWPLTVFITPDLNPFYGGTYYPPVPKYGMPSFTQVLEYVARLWKDSKGQLSKEAERVSASLQEMQKAETGGSLAPTLLDDAFQSLIASFDAEHGGFGGAPKFPVPISLEFLLRYHFRTGKELALTSAVKSLESMAAGGIYDHLGGGFHRYSTDKQWLIPHFEKMLYDNALMAQVYVNAFQVTRSPAMAEVAKETLGWMLGELQAPGGAFFAAQDADTEEGEGAYYSWNPQEVNAVLGARAAETFNLIYGVTNNGNFESGRTILHASESVESVAPKMGTTISKIRESLDESKRLLYQARLKRPRPATDTKILTSWNGLAISALAAAYGAFDDEHYREAAEKAAGFILTKCYKEGKLLRRFSGGEAGITATAEDYAFFGLGLLDIFEVTSGASWLEASIRLAGTMRTSFEDPKDGGFRTSGQDVPGRMFQAYDGPIPSGNAAAILLLLRLSKLTGNEEFGRSADKALRRFRALMDKEPSAHTYLLSSVDLVLNGSREVVISARDAGSAEPFLKKIRGRYLPDTTSFVISEQNAKAIARLSPLAEGRGPGTKAMAYVCQNFACKLPAKSTAELEAQLGSAHS